MLEKLKFKQLIVLLYKKLTFFRILLFSTILFFIILYNSDTIMFKYIDKVDEITSSEFQLKNKRNILMQKISRLNIFNNNFFNIPSDFKVPEYDVQLDQKNIDSLNVVIERALDMLSDKHKKVESISFFDNKFSSFSNSDIIYNENKYKGKIKLHGKTNFHWQKRKKSYSIKLKKENLINNTRNFGLVIMDEQLLTSIFSYDVARLYEYMDVNAGIVKLRLNGADQGLYILEEKLSKELLERNGLSGHDVIKVNDEWNSQYLGFHITPFTDEVSYVKHENYSKRDVGQLLMYEKLMQSTDFEEALRLIDVDRFARHEAMRILFGDDHSVAGDNLKLLYNTTTGKFFPYFRMEGYLKKLKFTKFSKTFDFELNNYEDNDSLNHLITFDKNLNNYFDWSINLFKMLNKNQDFRSKRNKYLYSILEDKNLLIEMYNDLIKTYKPLIKKDKNNNYSYRWYFNEINKHKESLVYNLNVIEKYLNYSRVFCSLEKISRNEYKLKISTDSNSPLKIDNLSFQGIDSSLIVNFFDHQKSKNIDIPISKIPLELKETKFLLKLDDNLEVEKNPLFYTIKFYDNVEINKFNISFSNIIDGSKVKLKNIWTKILKTSSKVDDSYSDNSEKFKCIENYKNIHIEGKNIVFGSSQFDIKKDIILPFGYNLVLLGGAKIFLSEGKSILVYGSLNVLGENKKVIIQNKIQDKNFGVVAVIGNKYSNVNINGLELYGGSEDFINGIYLSGALSLYNHDFVNVSNSIIHGNVADDALNIKNAKINIRNNKFYANAFDQIDLDFCDGIVDSNIFSSYEEKLLNPAIAITAMENDGFASSNGDGLDLSGSIVILKNNYFKNFKDKGVSVGEKTKIFLSKNNFIGNKSAITVKDESSAFFSLNIFRNNEMNLDMYIKKNIFNYPNAYFLNFHIQEEKINKPQLSHIYYTDTINYFDSINNTTNLFSEIEQIKWIKNL